MQINRRELFKRYSTEFITNNDLEEIQNIFDYASGLVIKNSQLAESYETTASMRNSDIYLKACRNQDNYTKVQREDIKKTYKETNKYYKSLLDNYNIDPYDARMAEDFEILTSVTKYNNGKLTLEDYQENLFLSCYKNAVFYYNNVTRTKSFQNEQVFREFIEVYLIFVAIQNYITERMKDQFNVSTFNKYQCKNYFISNGVDYFDELPLFFQRRLIELLNDLQRNKGTDNIFPLIKSVLNTNNLNIYRYTLVKTNDNDLKFYKVPYNEEISPNENEIYSFEEITGNDPYWRSSKNEVLYQTFNTLDTKYISVEYVVDILKNSYLFSYFMYLLNDLMITTKKNGQETRLQFIDNEISGNKIRLYDAVMALFSLFFVYMTNDEKDGDIIHKINNSDGTINNYIQNIYGYRSYLNTPEVISLIDEIISKLNTQNENIYNKYKDHEDLIDDTTIQWNLDLIEFLKTFNLKNFYYSENYSLDTIIYYYENPYKMNESESVSDNSQNCKSEFLELARFIKSRNIHDSKNDVLGLINLYSLVAQDNITDAFDYLKNLIFNGDLNIEFLSIHRDLKLVFKKYIAYCIINGIISTSDDINEYNSEEICYSQKYDMFYTFFVSNEVIFNEFITYIERNYGYDIPLLDDYLEKRFTNEGPDSLIKLIKSLEGFMTEDRLLKFRNLYTYLDLFTTFKNEIFNDSKNLDFNSNFVSLSQNYENTNINNFMQILNKNNEMRKKLENYILNCNDREIYNDLKKLWNLKFCSNFDYSLYKDYSYFKDYVLDNNDELYDYITNFGSFDNDNDKRQEIENRILHLCTSIENYISSNENFIYNSTFNVIFSKIKDYAKTMIDVFKAYTLDTIYSGNVLSFDDKFSNHIKLFDSVDNLELEDLVFTAPPEYLDIQDGIYKDDNSFDMQYIQYVQNVIDNVNYEDDGSPAVLPEYVKKYLKCSIYIYEENDLPSYLTSNQIGSIEPYFPVLPYKLDDKIYDSQLINDFINYDGRKDEFNTISVKNNEVNIKINTENRFFIRYNTDNNFWLPNRIILNQKMQKPMITVPNTNYLDTSYYNNIKDGLVFLVKKDLINNNENTVYEYNKINNTFDYKSNNTSYPSLVLEGNSYDKINLNFGKRYATFGTYSQRDVLEMYYNMIIDGKLPSVSEDELSRSFILSDGTIKTSNIDLQNLNFLIKGGNTNLFKSINDEFLKNFSTYGYTDPNSSKLDTDINDEINMRGCVVLINLGDYYQYWLYTGTNKNVNNGFKYLGPSIYIDSINVFYEPLRFYGDKSFDNEVERRELQKYERIPLTENVKIDSTTGEKYELQPEPTINTIEKVFHRNYNDKDKFSIKNSKHHFYVVPTHFNVSFNTENYGLSENTGHGVSSSFNVNSNNFRFTIPETINNNATMLTYYASITIPKNKSTITITTEDGNTIGDKFNSNFAFIAVENKGITNTNDNTDRPLLSEIVKLNNDLNLNLNINNINQAAQKINSFSTLSRFTSNDEQDINNITYDNNLNYTRLIDTETGDKYYDYKYAKSINAIEKIVNSGRIKGHLSEDLFAGRILLLDENNNTIYDLNINKDDETFFNNEIIIDNDSVIKNKEYRLIIVNTIMNTASNIGDFICNLDLDENNCEDLTVNSKEIIYDNDRYGNTICCLDIHFTPGYNCKIKLKLSGIIIFETIVDYDFSEVNSDKYDLLFLSPYNYRDANNGYKDSKSHSGQLVYYDDESGVEYLPYNYTLHEFTELNNNPNRKVYISSGCNSTTLKKESNFNNTIHSVMNYWMADDYDENDNLEHECRIQDIGQQVKISSPFKKDNINCEFAIKQNWDINLNKWIIDDENYYKLNYGENQIRIKYNSLFSTEHQILTNFPSMKFRILSNKYIKNVSFTTLLLNLNEYSFYKNKNIKNITLSPLLILIQNRSFYNSNIEEIYFLNNHIINLNNNYIPIDNNKNINDDFINENYRYLTIGDNCFEYTNGFKNTHFCINFPKNVYHISTNAFNNSTINQIDFSRCDYLNILNNKSFSIDNSNYDYLNRRYIITEDNKEYKDSNGNYVYEGEVNNNVIGDDLQPKNGYKFSDFQYIILPHGDDKYIIWLKSEVFTNRDFIRVVSTGNAFAIGCSAFNNCRRLNFVELPEVIYFGNFSNNVTLMVHGSDSKHPCKKINYNNKNYYVECNDYYNNITDIFIDNKYYKFNKNIKTETLEDGSNLYTGVANLQNENEEGEDITFTYDDNIYYLNNGYRSEIVNIPDAGYYNSVFNNCYSLFNVIFSNKLRIISDYNFINTGRLKIDKNKNVYLNNTEKYQTSIDKLINIGKLYNLSGSSLFIKSNSINTIKEYYNVDKINNISNPIINITKVLDENDSDITLYDNFCIQFYNTTYDEYNSIKKKINWNIRSEKNKFAINSFIDNINLMNSPYVPFYSISTLNETSDKNPSDFTGYNYFALSLEDSELYYDKIINSKILNMDTNDENYNLYKNQTFDIYSLKDFDIDNESDSNELKNLKAKARYSLNNFDKLLKNAHNNKVAPDREDRLKSNEIYRFDENEIDNFLIYNKDPDDSYYSTKSDHLNKFMDRYYGDSDVENTKENIKNYFKDLTFFKYKENSIKVNDDLTMNSTYSNTNWYTTIKSKYRNITLNDKIYNIPSRIFLNSNDYFYLDFENDLFTNYYVSTFEKDNVKTSIYNETIDEIFSDIVENKNPIFKDNMSYTLGYGSNRRTDRDPKIKYQTSFNGENYSNYYAANNIKPVEMSNGLTKYMYRNNSNFDDLLNKPTETLLTPDLINYDSSNQYILTGCSFIGYGLMGNEQNRNSFNIKYKNDLILYNCENGVPLKDQNDKIENYLIQDNDIKFKLNECIIDNEEYKNKILKYDFSAKYTRGPQFYTQPNSTFSIIMNNDKLVNGNPLSSIVNSSFIYKIYGIITDNNEIIGVMANGWENETVNNNYKSSDRVIYYKEEQYELLNLENKYIIQDQFKMSDVFDDFYSHSNFSYKVNNIEIYHFSTGIRKIILNENVTTLDNGYKLHM